METKTLLQNLAVFSITSLATFNFSSTTLAQNKIFPNKFTFQNQTGVTATNLKLTYSLGPVGGFSDAFLNNTIIQNDMITFAGGGGSVAPLDIIMGTTLFRFDLAVLLDAEWSFLDQPNEPIQLPRVRIRNGGIRNQLGGTDGFFVFENLDSSTVFFDNVIASKNVPSTFFEADQVDLEALNDNDLFIGSGESANIASSFSLNPNESIIFNLGPANPEDYLVTFFDTSFSPNSTGEIRQGHASPASTIPEPSTIFGLVTLGILSTKLKRGSVSKKSHIIK